MSTRRDWYAAVEAYFAAGGTMQKARVRSWPAPGANSSWTPRRRRRADAPTHPPPYAPVHFDALAAACMAAELQAVLCPGRIQAALLVDDNSLGLEVYAHGARHQLLLCAAPNTARVHLVDHKLRRGVQTETPLLLLVRKYLRDAALMAVTQPDPYERVLRFHCEHKQHGATTLLLELIGRQANLLLLRPAGHSDWRILECLHRHAAPAGPRAAAGEPPPAG